MFKINVGGKYFTTSKITLQTKCVPNFFYNHLKNKPESEYIFIDREPQYFNLILNHIRGYTISLPEDKNALRIIYEDVKFYKIRTMIEPLEEILMIKLKPDNRAKLCDYIKNISENYNIPVQNLNSVDDQSLILLKESLEKQVIDIKKKKFRKTIFDGLAVAIKFIQEKYNFEKIELEKHETNIMSLLENILASDSSYMFQLCMYISSMFHK